MRVVSGVQVLRIELLSNHTSSTMVQHACQLQSAASTSQNRFQQEHRLLAS
jgi:hypothetical protein